MPGPPKKLPNVVGSTGPYINIPFPESELRAVVDQPNPVGYTRHDAATAASIVQWFGTNVGMAFVRDVLKRYDALVQEQRVVQAGRWWWRRAQNDALFRVPRHKILKAQVNATRERLKRLAQEMEKKR